MIHRLFKRIAEHLIERAMRTPYFHLHHADGTFYMERYWLVPFANAKEGCWIARWWKEPSVWLLQQLGIAVRIHFIHSPDLDRALHDHPWPWLSVVLRGGYLERRPVDLSPCFAGDEEMSVGRWRFDGSAAFRHATDRHRITDVLPGTVTLFITGPKVQWWGFYTPLGKIHYRDYESVHNKEAIR